MKYTREKGDNVVTDVAPVWVVPLATVNVEGLIDVCQPASEQLPEANFQSKLGHIPLGSLWQLHRGTPKVCFPPNSQSSLSEYGQIVLVTELRPEVVLWETFSECRPRSPL